MAEIAGKIGAVYAQSGDATTMTTKPIGTGDAATVLFYLQEPVIDCEAVSPTASGSILAGDWTSSGATAQTLTADATDEKEGTYCIKNDVTTVAGAQTCLCLFTMDDVQDWHDKARVNFWVRCDRIQSAFTSARFEVVDSSNNRSYWNLTFAAGTWTRVNCLLGTPDGNSGTAAVLTLVKKVQLSFVAADTTVFYQEIDWIGITPEGIARSATILVDGVAQAINAYTLTTSGTLTFTTAPAAVAITATYNYYAVVQTTGFFGYSLNLVGDPIETTDYSDVGIRTYISGCTSWAGSAERHWLTTETMDGWLATERIVKFFTDASSDPQLRYEGWAIISGESVTSAVDTLVNESLSFQGCGIITYVEE